LIGSFAKSPTVFFRLPIEANELPSFIISLWQRNKS
jgi:hypothetical protein